MYPVQVKEVKEKEVKENGKRRENSPGARPEPGEWTRGGMANGKIRK